MEHSAVDYSMVPEIARDIIHKSYWGTRYEGSQNGISSAVGGGFCFSWLVDVTAGMDASAKAETEKGVELVVVMSVLEVEAAAGGGRFVARLGGGGAFITCHFKRSRVAMESSTEE